MDATVPPETIRHRKSTKKRVRNFSSEDRAAHRIFERGRREAFKERLTVWRSGISVLGSNGQQLADDPTLQELAGYLPILADKDPKHLSKHVVVDESIARHKLLESRCVEALREIESLVRERDELLAEVNTWRRGAGTSPRLPQCTSSLDGLVEAEKQSQQHAVPDRLGDTRKHLVQNVSSDDRNQVLVAIPDEIDLGQSHVPRVLPTNPTHDQHAPSNLDSLLLDPSWSDIIQEAPAAFPTEPLIGISDQDTLKSNMVQDSLPMPTSNTDDYQTLADIGLHRQMPLLNMGSVDFPPPDTGPSTAAAPIIPNYLFVTNLGSGVSLQQSQEWASWHG